MYRFLDGRGIRNPSPGFPLLRSSLLARYLSPFCHRPGITPPERSESIRSRGGDAPPYVRQPALLKAASIGRGLPDRDQAIDILTIEAELARESDHLQLAVDHESADRPPAAQAEVGRGLVGREEAGLEG